jgi:superfamily II DNA or RNA helicase
MAAVPKPAKAPAVKAMKHQAESLKVFAKASPVRLFDMSDPGTGKTFVEIIAFDKARKKGEALLVLAPKSLLESAWAEDIMKFAPHLKVSVAWAENREEAFTVAADVYVTNHDAVNWLAKKPKTFFKRFVRVVVDESTAFRNPTTQRSKALNKIKLHFRDRIAMSGTPNPRSITDIFNQVMFVDDGKRLGQSFYAFRQAVCAPVQVGPRREMVRWEDKEGAEEAVFALLADMTIRHCFQDCIDIPENFQYTMPYKMPTKQLRAYKEMAMTQLAAVQGKVINAINAAAVRTKLLQIASGAVYEHSEQYHLVDAGRYELVMDLVEDRKHSIVFFLWQHQRDFMVAEAEKRGIKYCVIDGKTPVKQRNEMVKDYQAGFYQVLFAHPASAAHGLTLTRATTTIWPSPTDNLEWFVQGNKRAFRNGQKQKTETIIVLSDVAVEQAVYKNLMGKDARMGNLLDLFAGL